MDEKKQTMIKANTLGLFIARRNSGKSYLMTHLLYLMAKAKNFNWVVVISPTKHTGEWSAILNEHDVKESFNPEWMNNVLEQQALSRKKKKPNPGLIILDDCLGRVNFHSDLMTRIATAGRHYDLTIWCAFQLYHKVPTVLRENADYVFLLGKISEKISKSIFEELCIIRSIHAIMHRPYMTFISCQSFESLELFGRCCSRNVIVFAANLDMFSFGSIVASSF
jgi:hypothetical protein